MPISGRRRSRRASSTELLITFGSMGIPNSEWCRLFRAKRLSEPPLCSKNAQKSTEKKMNTSAARMRLFSLAVELAHLPAQVEQRGRPDDVHEEVGVARVGHQDQDQRDRRAASRRRWRPPAGAAARPGTSGPNGDRPMGPRFRRVARKVTRLMVMATDTRAKASRQRVVLAHPDHQDAAEQRAQVDARVEQAEAGVAAAVAVVVEQRPPSSEMFGLKKPVPMIVKQVPM